VINAISCFFVNANLAFIVAVIIAFRSDGMFLHAYGVTYMLWKLIFRSKWINNLNALSYHQENLMDF